MSSFELTFTPPVIAHRGVRVLAPENTLAAFQKVAESGASWIETDVKLTHDGVPILIHDETLDRTTNGHGLVADCLWKDMQSLDAGSWFDPTFQGEAIPRLIDTLQFVIKQNLHINLEIKPCPGRVKATVMVTLIEASKIWPENRPPPLISSFDIEALIIAAQIHPEWPRGLLLDSWHEDWADLVKSIIASSLNMKASLLTEERVNILKQANLPILAYTVNNVAEAKKLLHWGVTAVFSDNPHEIISSL